MYGEKVTSRFDHVSDDKYDSQGWVILWPLSTLFNGDKSFNESYPGGLDNDFKFAIIPLPNGNPGAGTAIDAKPF